MDFYKNQVGLSPSPLFNDESSRRVLQANREIDDLAKQLRLAKEAREEARMAEHDAKLNRR